jgi:small-conductance mechanosensitive channel
MIESGNLSDFTEIIIYNLQGLWHKITNTSSIIEFGIVLGIFFAAYLLQNLIHHKSQKYVDAHIKKPIYIRLVQFFSFLLAPIISFLLLSLVMSIFAHFTPNLEIYKISIKLTFVWFIWIIFWHSVNDVFLRWVSFFTLIPLLIFAAFGLADPLVNYLDSLSFSLGEIHISIFKIFKGIFIASCLFWFARSLSYYVIEFIESQKKVSVEIRDLIENIFQIIIYTAVVLITLDILGIDLKSLAIIGGAVGIGIGLGLQKIAANFISGLILLFEQNVKVGHLVEVPGGNPGWIRHLGTRAAVIDTGDGKEVLIPNEELLTKTVVNWTAKDKKIRIDLIIKVSFESNLERAKEIMLDVVSLHANSAQPQLFNPSCVLQKFTDIGAQFLLQFWVNDFPAVMLSLQDEVLLTIWKRFTEEKIKFSTFDPRHLYDK